MLAYVLDAWDEAAVSSGGSPRPVVVYSPAVEAIRPAFADRAEFALQHEPRGTGDAVRAALAAVPGDADEILVLSGDVPLITAVDLDAILEARRQDDAAIALATVFAAEPAQLGRVVRSDFGTVEGIVEARDATEDELDGNEVNAGLYAFDAAWLRRRIGSLEASATTGELYLTELVRLAREDGRLVSAVAFEDDGRFDGINDRSQLAAAEWNLRVRRNERHMRDGVTMRDPSTVYLDWDVTLAADVTLEPNVILRGHTTVGQGSVIGAGSQIVDSDRRTVQPPAAGQRGGSWRTSRQLRRTEERAPGRRVQAAPHELLRRRRDRGAGQHRRRRHHRQLRRLEEAPHDHR